MAIARALLGKVLWTRLPMVTPDANRIGRMASAGIGHPVERGGGGLALTAVWITETEAYAGPHDRASHAHGNRRTPRTETLFAGGGVAYVYLCYGLHHLFNVVTGPEDLPHAVLLRAGLPLAGAPHMQRRSGRPLPLTRLVQGPGRLSRALGIRTAHNGETLTGPRFWIEDRGIAPQPADIQCLPRVGVDYAGIDAKRPWRFVWTPENLPQA